MAGIILLPFRASYPEIYGCEVIYREKSAENGGRDFFYFLAGYRMVDLRVLRHLQLVHSKHELPVIN